MAGDMRQSRDSPPPQLTKGFPSDKPEKKGRAGEPPPTATPTQPPTTDGTAPRERQSRTTTEVEEGPPHLIGQAPGTGEGLLAPHKAATHPSRGDENPRAGVK